MLSFVFLLSLVTLGFGQSCTLLSGSNYKDYSTFSSISQLCSQDISSLSEWEKYQCSYINGRNETCWPRRYLSNCGVGSLAGIVFFYHGYSACPDQYIPLVSKLRNKCFHIYLPTTVGHGLNYCSVNTSSQCINGYNLTYLPTSRRNYLKYIDYMNFVMADELNVIKNCELQVNSNFNSDKLEVVLGGLSLGAALSGGTALRAYLYDMKWTKEVLMSPFLGVSYAGADTIIYKCNLNSLALRKCLPYYFDAIGADFEFENGTNEVLANLTYDLIAGYINTEFIDNSYETLNLLVRKIITYSVETNDTSVTENEDIQDLLDSVIGWGDKCVDDQITYGRGGFCSFRARHLAAAHSLGDYVLENVKNSILQNTIVDTLFVMVERDGPTRNSLAAEYAQLLYNNNETMLSERAQACMWLIASECQSFDNSREIDNTCGVPHSCMSTKDNYGNIPYYLWWNETYNNGIISYVTNNLTYPKGFNVLDWDGDKDECVFVDLNDPPPTLIADVTTPLELIVNIGKQALTDSIRNSVLNSLSNITGVPRGVLELTVSVIQYLDLDNFYSNNSYSSSDSSNSDSDNNVLFNIYLTSEAAFNLNTLLIYNALNNISSYLLEYASLNDNNYVITINTEVTKSKCNNDNDIKWWGILLIIVSIILCFVVSFFVYIGYKNYKMSSNVGGDFSSLGDNYKTTN